ncbi:protein SGT1 homolog [Actinia tenebrosa]|uniref:Protein SGT1 homolog n=1 Tax=Actinia tenebrosa TaxID=6105 RepID=A0A6P8IW02_ACTTE|nr:protein SGT1 homolog [Actinia tenebrosa]
MNDSELFSEGNEAFVDENYQLALQKYTNAIELNGFNPKYYVKRATTYFKLGNFRDACTDANVAIDLDSKNIKAHLRKGVSLFHLGEFADAKQAFEQGLQIDNENIEMKTWLSKCNSELGIKDSIPEKKQERVEPAGEESPNISAKQDTEGKEGQEEDIKKKQEEQKIHVRHDWYQTDTQVVVALMIKNCHAQNVNISYHEQALSGTVNIPTGGEYKLDFNLAHPINVKECKTRILQSKIELKLKKAQAIHWTTLEKTSEATKVKSFPTATTLPTASTSESKESIDIVHQYPSSRHVVKDWDRLAADITKDDDDEKQEGEAALSALFQKIYGDGGDAVKKAMNKSFIESGGTVLSTNWEEVQKSKVERKPPDGMEWKSWEH